MRTPGHNNFIFSPRYHLRRHVLFWTLQLIFWPAYWSFLEVYNFTGLEYSHAIPHPVILRHFILVLIWLPANMLYTYSLAYLIVPTFLLTGKYVQFILAMLPWICSGVLLNYVYRVHVFIPAQEVMRFTPITRGGWQAGTYFMISLAAASFTILKLFKYWLQKQHEWVLAEKEKVTVELQLLKAQVHPHFLFNTLNNIYSFSLENSSKAPAMILKLSSLLSYILYDCSKDEVRLEKEIETMKNYMDLEKERYGNTLDISWMVTGEIKDKFIAPLLLLPFIENAFKHGISNQLEKPWMSVEIAAERNALLCKMINSKNVDVPGAKKGIGIQNAMKRLEIIYPDKHELKITDEGIFFVVSLKVDLHKPAKAMT